MGTREAPCDKRSQSNRCDWRQHGALASAYQALQYPHIFGKVLAQSGVYGWPLRGEKEWLIQQYIESPTHDIRFFLDTGILETVLHFDYCSGIMQMTRHFRDVLKAKGYPVSYVEFAGGHDYICWQETFALGLEHLLAN